MMEKEKRLIAIGDKLYIIGKYSFSPDENPKAVEVQVAYRYRNNYYFLSHGWSRLFQV